MIVAILTILFMGGGSFGPLIFINEADDNAKKVIIDADRRKEVRATLKSMKGVAKLYSKEIGILQKSLTKEFAVHETDSASIEGFWKQGFDLNANYGEDLFDLRFELREQVSREEWAGLFPVNE